MRKARKYQIRLLKDLVLQETEIIREGAIGRVCGVDRVKSRIICLTVEFDYADVKGWPKNFPPVGWPGAAPTYDLPYNRKLFQLEPLSYETDRFFQNRQYWLAALDILHNAWLEEYRNLKYKRENGTTNHPMVHVYVKN